MKKNKIKDQEQNRKPRRLSLSRETIRLLEDPALLELAGGGIEERVPIESRPPYGVDPCCATGSSF